MPDFNVDNPGDGSGQNQGKARIRMNKEIEGIIDDFLSEYDVEKSQVIDDVLEVLQRTRKFINDQVEEHNNAIRDILGQFHNKKQFGSVIRKARRAEDAEGMGANFDEMVEYAAKYHSGVIGAGEHSSTQEKEEGLLELLREGIQKAAPLADEEVVSNALDEIHDVLGFAEELAAFDFDYFKDFDRDTVFAEEFYNSLKGSLDKVSDTIDKKLDDPSIADIGNKLQDKIDDVIEAVLVHTADNIEQDFSSQENRANAPSSSKAKSKASDSLDDLEFSATESLMSQLLSRITGSSYYPVLTALRASRKAHELETGEKLGPIGMLKYANQSFNKMFGFGGGRDQEQANEELNDTVDRFAETVDNNNDVSGDNFGGSFGDDNEERSKEATEDSKNITQGEKIAAISVATALAATTVDALSDLSGGIKSAASEMFNGITTMLTGDPTQQSAISVMSSPISAAGSLADGGGKAVGGVIGGIAKGPAGAVIGARVGGAAGAVIEGLLKANVSLLTSIDAGMERLSSELAPFNADLMGAQTERQIQQLQDRISQADEIGPILAENTRARSEFESELRELGTEFIKVFGDDMTKLIETGTEMLHITKSMLGIGRTVLSIMPAFNNLHYFRQAIQAIAMTLSAIEKNTDNEPFPDPLLDNDSFLNPALNRQFMGAIQGGGGLNVKPMVPGIDL